MKVSKNIPLEIASLGAVSRRIGERIPFWTQAAGGNLSVKAGNELWIKSSGTRLSSVGKPELTTGLSAIRIQPFLRELENLKLLPLHLAEEKYSLAVKEGNLDPARFENPSMETGFHAILPKKWIIHFHSLVGIIAQERGLLKRSGLLNYTEIEDQRPGWALVSEIKSHSKSDIIMMRRHGIILQFDCSEENLWNEFEEKWIKPELELARKILSKSDFCLFQGEAVTAQWMDEEIARRSSKRSLNLMPDIAVFQRKIQAMLCQIDSKDIAAKELWLASQILEDYGVSEIPTEVTNGMAEMPSEKIRLNKS
jgi:rhamnose utilization protein RhaD (predicted bifunctional aldolase and dehydrogenase)